MKVYVFLVQWSIDYEENYDLRVYEKKEDAIKRFKEEIKKAKEEFKGTTYFVENQYCQIYEDGEYIKNHITINILEEEIQ